MIISYEKNTKRGNTPSKKIDEPSRTKSVLG
jgi:hypothetical protein